MHASSWTMHSILLEQILSFASGGSGKQNLGLILSKLKIGSQENFTHFSLTNLYIWGYIYNRKINLALFLLYNWRQDGDFK